jgi:hypothetical protein
MAVARIAPVRDVNPDTDSGVEVAVVPGCNHRALGGNT